jgi:hypothetical protein
MYVCDGVTVKKENRASLIESLVSFSDDHLAYMSRGSVDRHIVTNLGEPQKSWTFSVTVESDVTVGPPSLTLPLVIFRGPGTEYQAYGLRHHRLGLEPGVDAICEGFELGYGPVNARVSV